MSCEANAWSRLTGTTAAASSQEPPPGREVGHGESIADAFAGSVESAHEGALGRAEEARGFGVAEAVDVDEQDGLAEPVGKRGEGRVDDLLERPANHQVFGGFARAVAGAAAGRFDGQIRVVEEFRSLPAVPVDLGVARTVRRQARGCWPSKVCSLRHARSRGVLDEGSSASAGWGVIVRATRRRTSISRTTVAGLN